MDGISLAEEIVTNNEVSQVVKLVVCHTTIAFVC